MWLGSIIALIVLFLSVLLILGLIGLSNMLVGGMFFGLALAQFGPVIETRIRGG